MEGKIKMKRSLVLVVILICTTTVYSQNQFQWNGKKCAVVLTYDDALNEHLDNVVPLLDSLELHATFYVPPSFPGFYTRMDEWKIVAQKGHELGNHTLFHPCIGSGAGREWAPQEYNLNDYSLKRIRDEMVLANSILKFLDGKEQRTFAYPCGDMTAEGISYKEIAQELFIGARGVSGGIVKSTDIDIYNVNCYMVNGESSTQLIELVKKSLDEGGLMVFLFHGVGGGSNLNVSLLDHRDLLLFLKNNQSQIWVAPMKDVLIFLQNQ